MSKLAAQTTAAILAAFAGQTVTHDEVSEQIENNYAAASRKAAYGSYTQIHTGLLIAGVKNTWTGPNYTGEMLYTFPIPAI